MLLNLRRTGVILKATTDLQVAKCYVTQLPSSNRCSVSSTSDVVPLAKEGPRLHLPLAVAFHPPL